MTRRVVVAHEADAIRNAALRALREAGLEAVGVADGESARVLAVSPPHPAAMVLDVGLPGVLGYEICEEIQERKIPTRVVLVASVYSRTAYKRAPTTLYGADDYVEQHHVPNQLVPKLLRLLPDASGVHLPRALPPSEGEEEARRIQEAGEGRLAFQYQTQAEAFERAQRLARIIVADILLYNGSSAQGGIDEDHLDRRLSEDLDAGRALFSLRVPREIASMEDFIGQAVAELGARRRGEGSL
ncbi:MAG: response regulator [Deltaproteobacteria bacterium]|nr:response regulator [Deltaproteobacteria bacterium]